MNRKYKQYREHIVPSLRKKFDLINDLQVPKIQKIVLSRGVNSEEARAGNQLEEMQQDLALIAGQKPVVRPAKKSISTFKIREGMPNGVMVTLRGENMYAFLDKFISVAAPRIRDFQGFKIKSDGFGNYTVGIKDQRIFVEAESRAQRGLQITIVTSGDEEKSKALLQEFGFPFSKN